MNDLLRHRLDGLHERVDGATEAIHEALAEAKPHLRGWLHLATAPLALAAGIVLIALSPDATTRIGSAVFAASALVLSTVSALDHRGTWSPGTHSMLKRFDHSNIFVLIAGSCTPFALLLLEGRDMWTMLGVVWGGALAGVLMKVFWKGAPRALSAPIYIALGLGPGLLLRRLRERRHGPVRRPAPAPPSWCWSPPVARSTRSAGSSTAPSGPTRGRSWFGFHEVFHTFTILAFVTHYVGVSVATYSLR